MSDSESDDFLSADEGSDFEDTETDSSNKLIGINTENIDNSKKYTVEYENHQENEIDLSNNACKNDIRENIITSNESADEPSIASNETIDEPRIADCLDYRLLSDNVSSDNINKCTPNTTEILNDNDKKQDINNMIINDCEKEIKDHTSILEKDLLSLDIKDSYEDLIIIDETPELSEKETNKNDMIKDEATKSIKEDTKQINNEGELKELEKNIAPIPKNIKKVKESKIGMKKPREKLGERLGAKKLGSRLGNKTLTGKTCDNPEVEIVSNPIQNSSSSENLENNNASVKDNFISNMTNIDNENNFKSQTEQCDDSWGSWGGWGSSLVSAATTLTQEIGHGVGTVMQTVEGTLGVPDPETLARESLERKMALEKLEKYPNESFADIRSNENEVSCIENEPSEGLGLGLGGFSSFGSLVSGVSGVLGSAGNKVIYGGLDTLELIGRKTMDVLQDGDPGLRKKRAFLTNKKPNLSAVLQEARNSAAQNDLAMSHVSNPDNDAAPELTTAWDASEGPIHMEALSLVAKQCEHRTKKMLNSQPIHISEKLQSANSKINDCIYIEDKYLDGDFEHNITSLFSQIHVPITHDKILKSWNTLDLKIKEMCSDSLMEENINWRILECSIYQCISSLMTDTIGSIHKVSEIALISPELDPLQLANIFNEICGLLSRNLESKVDSLCEAITSKAAISDPNVNKVVTNIYLQAAKGNNIMEEALFHLSKILQQAQTKMLIDSL